MKIQKRLFVLLIALFYVGCSFTDTKEISSIQKTKNEGDLFVNAPTNIAWQGYYHGVLPCANCKGIDTWLSLYEKDGHCYYILHEKHLGKENISYKGCVQWLKNRTIAQLLDLENRYLFLSDSNATFIFSMNDELSKENTLEKFHLFKNENATLLVKPSTIQVGKMDGKMAVKFSGITNLGAKAPSGYKSFRSTYLLKCDEKKFKMSRIAYYDKLFTMGNFVYPKESLSGYWFPTDSATLMKQVRMRYCE